MKYQGGKARLAKEIRAFVAERAKGRPYIEPFLGGGSVLAAVGRAKIEGASIGSLLAGDANRALVTMFRALRSGWDPPEELSREEWVALRDRCNENDPLTAFAAFGCSFMGMWFAGYDPRGARATARSLRRKLEAMRGATILCQDYRCWEPEGCIVYCDPPYANTCQRGYIAAGGGGFDADDFWATMRRWCAMPNTTVLVSEYEAPPDVPMLFEKVMRGGFGRGGKKSSERVAVDRIFILE